MQVSSRRGGHGRQGRRGRRRWLPTPMCPGRASRGKQLGEPRRWESTAGSRVRHVEKIKREERCVHRDAAAARARWAGGKGAREELDAADPKSAVASPAPRPSESGRRGSRRLGRRPPQKPGQAHASGVAQLQRRARVGTRGAAAPRQRQQKAAAAPPLRRGERVVRAGRAIDKCTPTHVHGTR